MKAVMTPLLKVFRNLNDMAVAAIIFLSAGAVMIFFNGFVLRAPTMNQPWIFVIILIIIALMLTYILLRGYQFSAAEAGTIMTLAVIILSLMTFGTRSELGAINNGFYFIIIYVYMLWFLPMFFARAVILSALVIYAITMIIKFDSSVYALLITILLTNVVLGELIFRFKGKIESHSLIDALTGIWNKRGLDKLLAREIMHSHRADEALSIIFMDLDDFKKVNDTFGHREGDWVLKEFCSILNNNIRPRDALARIGGDEFLLVLPDSTASEAVDLVTRMRAVSNIQWSYGIAEYVKDESADDLMERADKLLYEDKNSRKR